ncbi:MAG: ABC transporter ATP-binding protein [Chloroflexota bacterium]|nr:ABC transporter ATP-binding protein [Chloroflexota bacterium]
MPAIELRGIHNYACRGVNLQVLPGELLVLLGPNGAGKTTLLNIIAGLIEYEGAVLFDGVSVDGLPPQRRGVGYLFQDLVLFPHLDVASNIAYGLRARGWSQEKAEARVEELLRLMRIEHLASRYPRHLSGGEMQRVALARALAPSPRILLLDEPLNSLDLQTSKYLRVELKQLQRRLGITTLYVTHELAEAEEVADRLAIIQEGRIEQVGKPEEVFFWPANEKVAAFIGAPNILQCNSTRSLGHGLVEVSCGGLPIVVPHEGNAVRRIALFPWDIYVSPMRPPGPDVNRFEGTISSMQVSLESGRLTVKVGTHQLVAELPHHIFESLGLRVGQKVFLIFKLKKIKVCEDAGQYKTSEVSGGASQVRAMPYCRRFLSCKGHTRPRRSGMGGRSDV